MVSNQVRVELGKHLVELELTNIDDGTCIGGHLDRELTLGPAQQKTKMGEEMHNTQIELWAWCSNYNTWGHGKGNSVS